MKITCPNCLTSYQVPDDYIGAEGRSVRCAKCGETWHAEQPAPLVEEPQSDFEPSQEDEDAMFDAPPAESEEQSQDDIDAMFASAGAEEEKSQDDIDALFDSPGGGAEQSQDDIDAMFASAGAEEEKSQDDIDALFDSPGGGEEQSQDDIDALFDSPGGGEEQSQDDIDALFDSPGGGEEQSQDDIDALFDSPGGGEDQSQDDIDAMFDAPGESKEQSQDDVDALFSTDAKEASSVGGEDQSVAEGVADKGNADPSSFEIKGDVDESYQAPVVDLMDADAFEEQKALARGRGRGRGRGRDIESSARRRGKRRKKAKAPAASVDPKVVKREWAIGGVAFAFLLSTLIALFAAPKFWVESVPDLASLYELIGMPVNVAGVDFSMVDVQLVQKSGSPVITVETELVNPGAKPVILPSVQFSVLGNEGSELYSWSIDPDHVGLGPGERKMIETSIAAPAQAKSISLRVFHQ